jgi:hypothetical protein
VGHTIQAGVNGACGQQVLRVDVGMSQGCGNSAVEVLEILGDKQVGVWGLLGGGAWRRGGGAAGLQQHGRLLLASGKPEMGGC